ncbi:polysaccharide deacetylase family protein [Streptomyces malaysiensis]|uniref:polysaccharide deacetylase family protein n=1 Tax=Streptomyces malaysiensis TaxID=92644 RepID=UPI002B2B4AFD|nr:polysaccharide deacetylase family protein [Streptomyces malaysiensis]
MSDISPAGPVKVAVTVDDLLLWDGVPLPAGSSPVDITRSMARTLTEHGVPSTYAFAHTYPVERDPALIAAFEAWVEAGHHLGNHTHHHAPLRWMPAEDFCADIARAERRIGRLIESAPQRYFRYPMDMSSGSESKRGQVEEYLRDHGYRNAPITAWFSDFAWIVPYYRALTNGDAAARKRLRDTYVSAAVDMLAAHAVSARRLFGADVPYIWLIHGSPIAADVLGNILDAFIDRNVEFIPLDEAMRHSANFGMPPCDQRFRNHLQRYALAAGEPAPELAPEVLGEVMAASPMPGVDTIGVLEESVLKPLARRLGAEYQWEWA